MNRKHLLALALLGASSVACAEDKKSGNFYVEAGYVHLNTDFSQIGDDDLGAGMLKFGYNAHENLAIEVMAATGFSKAEIRAAKVELSRAFGIYAKPKVSLGDAEIFVRLGYTDLKAKAKAYGESESSSDGGFSFGAGVSYSLTESVYAQVDYMRYYDREGLEVGGPSLSIGYKF
jgi:opacity protein-like surface antigen